MQDEKLGLNARVMNLAAAYADYMGLTQELSRPRGAFMGGFADALWGRTAERNERHYLNGRAIALAEPDGTDPETAHLVPVEARLREDLQAFRASLHP